MKTVTVALRWRDHDPVREGRFSSASSFPEHPEDATEGAWSIVLEFPSALGIAPDGRPLARAYFPFDEAPQQRLRLGAVFNLMAGRHVAVECEVIAD